MVLRQKKWNSQFFLYAGIIFFLSTSLIAQEDTLKSYYQSLQDVFQTDLVYPQEKNEVQLTVIPEFQHSDSYNHFQFPVIVEYGLTDNWQVEFSWNTFQKRICDTVPDVSGTGDIEIGTQYSFMNIGLKDFHAAFGFEINIPLADEDKELGEGLWEYEPYISLAQDIPSLCNMQLFMQTGIGFVSVDEEENDPDEEPEGNELNINSGFFIRFHPVIVTSELIWQKGLGKNNSEGQLYLIPGIVFDLPGKWEAGLGIPVGLNDSSDPFGIMALLTYEFSLGEDDD